MSLVQKLKDNHTIFDKLSVLFNKILLEQGQGKRTDVIFDVYLNKSCQKYRIEQLGCKIFHPILGDNSKS